MWVLRARARMAAVATGGGGVDVATCRRRQWSVVSGQWAVACVRAFATRA